MKMNKFGEYSEKMISIQYKSNIESGIQRNIKKKKNLTTR